MADNDHSPQSDEASMSNDAARAPEAGPERDRGNGWATGGPFPVVGIGASAGGLRAFERFFRALPDRTGMAFVLVQHLAPHHDSELAQLLQNSTPMAVTQVDGPTEVEPDHVYVIPPGKDLVIAEGTLRLSQRGENEGRHLPVDHFLRSLAEDRGDHAICVILSGTGADGTLGLKAVKERGGLTMAEAPDAAEYDGMPRNAVATGLVDYVAPTEQLAEKLVDYQNIAVRIHVPREEEPLPEDDTEALRRIFAQLRTRTGHDFSHYKRSTILRRLARRMQVTQVPDLPAYVGRIREDPSETHALFKDFLISVTNFFRDPESFEVLEDEVIPRLFEDAGDEVRVWVPGCATGEEAYSIAILLAEAAERRDSPAKLQVFATDIDEAALAFAREARYPRSVAADLGAERVRRFFVEEGEHLRVRKTLREIVLFAPHNLMKDAPFSRLDLVSCRNLLIYLNREVQEAALELFHYALRPGGFLFLGSSESTESAGSLFATIDKKARVFRRTAAAAALPRFPKSAPASIPRIAPDDGGERRPPASQSFDELHQRLLERIAPPSILVDRHYDIVHVSEAATPYIRVVRGEPSRNLLRVVHPDLRLDLRSVLYQAAQKGERASARHVQLERDGETERLHLIAEPVDTDDAEGFVQVLFKPMERMETLVPDDEADDAAEAPDGRVAERIEEELLRTKERLQTTIEEYESSNEELKASNEELQSMNEELQSTTEELETSREELQSMNEELSTVNQELDNKVSQLTATNNDLLNLISSTEIATIFLDRDLHITRFTPRATELFNVIPSDVGRPFKHLSHELDYDGLPDATRIVLRRLVPFEQEIPTKDRRWFLTRIVPYRTTEDRIEGAVLTFVDITDRKREESRLQAEHDVAQVLARSTSLDEATPGLVAALRDSLGGAIGELWLPGESGDTLSCALCAPARSTPPLEAFAERTEGFTFERDEGLVGKAWIKRAPVWVTDLHDSVFVRSSLAAEAGLVSGFAFPILTGDALFGVLGFYTPYRQELDRALMDMMAAIGSSIGQFIQRKRAEAEVRESEERLRRTLMDAPIPVVVTAEGGTFLLLNRAMQELTGYTPEEIPNVTAWVHRAYGAEAEDMIDVVEALFSLDGRRDEGEFEIRTKEDDRRVWHFHTAPLGTLPDGRRTIVTMAMDVTDERRAERQLRELNEALEERIQDRTTQVRDLASSLTLAEQRERHRIAQILHDDLQQLLFGAQLQLDIQDDSASGDGPVAERVRTAAEIIERAMSVARTLTIDLSPPILRGEGLREALEWLAAQMRDVHELDVQLDAGPDVGVEDEEMRVLLFNLVRELLFNVVKHADVDEVRLTVDHGDDRLTISVEDEGEGFDATLLSDYSAKGSGFGLYSVQERVRLFDGQLDVESQPGDGTRAVISVPTDALSRKA